MRNAQHSLAGILLEVFGLVEHPRDQLFEIPDGSRYDDVGLARVKKAIDLGRKDKGFILRALVEDWDAHRISRELY